MKISRSRLAAIGAAGLMIVGGANAALARNPQASAHLAQNAVEDPATGPDTDNVQQGDQSGPDSAKAADNQAQAAAGAKASARRAQNAVEDPATGPDTDNVQQGDQSGPDSAKALSASKVNKSAATGSDNESGSSTESESSAESDGPDGHADPNGQNVDHQFEGVE